MLNGTKQFITNIGLDNASIVLIAAMVASSDQGDIISTPEGCLIEGSGASVCI